jgi:N-acetylglucosaminyldiphosphoundecaprenol N-acetyl-beta-D-mannosaminyltransferase
MDFQNVIMPDSGAAEQPIPGAAGTMLPSPRCEKWRFRCGQLQLTSIGPDELFSGAPDGRFLQVAPVNAEVLVMAHQNERLLRLLRHTINTADGQVLLWLCRLLYPGRGILLLKGSDFILDLAAYCCRHGQRLFLLGSTEESNAGAVAFLGQRYPGLQVQGFGPPLEISPFEPAASEQILEKIQSFRPRHVGVCFGPGKQEFWIEQNAARLHSAGVRCAYGLGGTIDFLSGARPRAPRWMQSGGLEWFFRFLSEPRARFMRTLIQFKMPIYLAKTRRSISGFETL